ncbi:hypothetical protein L3Q82_025816, partial [Scortum barcoo]
CEVPTHLQEQAETGKSLHVEQVVLGSLPTASVPAAEMTSTLPKKTTTANRVQKRKRTSVYPPSKPVVGHPEVLNRVPSPQPCTSAADFVGLLILVPKPQSTIPPADLPVVSGVAPSPPPSTPPLCPDSPLRIHNRSVEYQQVYHEVVGEMLTYKNGRPRPYSLELGRRIKQKLWERLNRPVFTTSSGEYGLLRIDVSYGVGVSPPLYDVDISGEPKPKQPAQKRARH